MKIYLRILLLISFIILSGCTGSDKVTPTETPKPTSTYTPAPTATFTPTPSPTPEPTATYTPDPYAGLPEPPEGYEWVIAPESFVAFLVKEGWYYLEEFETDVNAYFVTQENIADLGFFTTGLTMNVFTNVEGDAAEFAELFITLMSQAETTTEVLASGDYEEDGLASFWVVILTEHDDPAYSEADRFKTIYFLSYANTTNNYLYLILFESPTGDWEAQEETAEILLTSFVFFDE